MRRYSRSIPWALGIALVLTPPPVEAQVRLALDWLYPAESIYFSDFDPFSPGLQPDLFAMTLQNLTGNTQSVVLELTVNMVRPQSVLLVRAATNPFPLQTGVRRISSKDLATTGRDVSAADFEFGSNSDVLTNQLRQTGLFPAGTYRFTVEVRTAQGIVLDRAEVSREVINPTRIELLSPGRLFGDPAPIVTTPSPRFLWSGDAPLAAGGGDYRIRVARVDAGVSAEEAMSGFAAWESRVRATTAVYPGSAQALPLEQGRTYAWQIVREVRTSGGVEQLESPIFWFRMSSPSGATDESAATSELVDQIAAIAQAFGLGGELQGFRPSGPAMVGGRPVTQAVLDEILRRIASGEIQVGTVTVR